MSGDAARDLDAWIPRLIAVWRRARLAKASRKERDRAPEADPRRLSPDEVRIVSSGVKSLSAGLTRERQLAGARYMDDPNLLGAYLLFYWPVSYAQARATLSELPSPPRSVLDLGSGPGPLAFAALDAGAREAVAADRSAPALALARELAIEAGEGLATRDWNGQRTLPDGRFDLVTLGHVLNELHGGAIGPRAELVEQVLQRVTPGGSALIIEPALRETSRALLQVRDRLVANGYAIRAPCLYRGNCPALVKDSDWCHAEREWKMPQLTEIIARSAGLHKESLKMSYLIVAPKHEAWPVAPEGQVFRVVSEQLPGKGRMRFMGCGPEGRVGLALQDKHRSDATKRFVDARRGDVLRVTNTEPRGDGLALGETSTVELVAGAGARIRPPGEGR